MLSHGGQLEKLICQSCNKLRSVITIRLNVEYPVILDCFLFFRKVHNFKDILISPRFLEIGWDSVVYYAKRK